MSDFLDSLINPKQRLQTYTVQDGLDRYEIAVPAGEALTFEAAFRQTSGTRLAIKELLERFNGVTL